MGTTTDIYINLLQHMGDLLHQTQRERGCAALFLDSGGKVFAHEYTEQCAQTDQEVARYRAFIHKNVGPSTLSPGLHNRLQGLVSKLDTLSSTRNELSELQSRYTLAINSYTFRFNIPIIDVIIETAHSAAKPHTARASAFASFIQWKERIGLERALGSRGFHAGAFKNPEFTDRVAALLEEQKSYLNTFLALAADDQVAVIQHLLDDDDMRAIATINELIRNGASPTKIEQYSGEAWYQLLTRTMDNIHNVEKQLVGGLVPEQKNETTALGTTKHAAASSLSAYKSFILTLPLFKNIPEDELGHILSQAQIRTYERGQLLFLQGEHATRLYIILNGWVKIFNGLESGEEATLQMLSSGEALMESAVLLDTSTPASAQVVEAATMLSIPSPVIREFIKRNSDFALGMLNNLSLRSQHLVRQIEQSRLKTAEERVGWFLLRLYMDQDEKKQKISLPYDKALIASYLDMRPETFSRALKKLKAKGFAVHDDHVIMPSANALCGFCDEPIAQDCARATTPDCPHHQKWEFDSAI